MVIMMGCVPPLRPVVLTIEPLVRSLTSSLSSLMVHSKNSSRHTFDRGSSSSRDSHDKGIVVEQRFSMNVVRTDSIPSATVDGSTV